MTDILRYVTLDRGGRPTTILDLNDMGSFSVVRESFTITPGIKQPTVAAANRRYGGGRQVAETTENGTVGWSALVAGTTADLCIASVEHALELLEANPFGYYLEWRPDGATKSSLYEIRGTGSWTSRYVWQQFAGTQSMVVDLSLPVAPLARGLPYDIEDFMAVDTRGDYTFDNGSSSNLTHIAEALEATANVTSQNRAVHTARGYEYGDNQQTIKATPKTTIASFKAGVTLKRLASTTRLDVYVEDNGTTSSLHIEQFKEAAPTSLATVNLASRISSGTAFWVRARIEGNIVTAEYWTSRPTPMGTPTLTTNTTLAGESATVFGTGVKAAPGWVFTPQHTGATIAEYNVEPYTYRNLTLPQQVNLSGAISGDAPALADITLTTAGAEAAPIWALLGWSGTPSTPLSGAVAPFGIIEAETASNLSGWVSTVNANTRGGKWLVDETASSSKTYTASWAIDPATLDPDTFSNEIAIEVWAKVGLAATLVSPNFVLSTRPEDGLNYGAARYTDEWGSAGHQVTVPGVAATRLTRLGTLRMLVDPLEPRRWLLWLSATVGAGSSGLIGLDYLVLVPVTNRACSPTGKPNDSTFPAFIPSTAETAKTIYHDLSARVAKPPAYGHPDHGLGGQLIELPAGEASLVCKLASYVPDDPTEGVSSGDVLAQPATLHVAVTPRWFLTRSGS